MKTTTQTADHALTATEIASKLAERKETIYSFVLVFARVFTRGSFAPGTRHVDRISFCSEAECLRWVDGINRRNAAGKVDYRVASHYVARASET